CSFTSTSSDPDGSIASYRWTFGDGSAAVTTQNASHTYGAGGTYTVTLQVTDNQGATNSSSQSVTVTAPNSPPVVNPRADAYTALRCTNSAGVMQRPGDARRQVDDRRYCATCPLAAISFIASPRPASPSRRSDSSGMRRSCGPLRARRGTFLLASTGACSARFAAAASTPSAASPAGPTSTISATSTAASGKRSTPAEPG